MLLVQRDYAGNLLAAIEWQLVNEDGQLDIHGAYVYVVQVEVNPHLDTRNLFRHFIEQSAKLAPTAKWAYWGRRKNPNRMPRCYSREQLLTFVRRDADVAVAV